MRRALNTLGINRNSHALDPARFPLSIRDRNLYQENVFRPWNGLPAFEKYYALVEKLSLISRDRCFVLWSAARQALHLPGDFMECGVYKGGSALMLAQLIQDADTSTRRSLHLFDTFSGMPKTLKDRDYHREGDFGDTSLKEVAGRFSETAPVAFHAGLVPQSFAGLEQLRFSLVHCDLDIYQAVLDCASFVYPRLNPGGVLVFDDYGFMTCTGARDAVDEFFADKPEFPLVLPTGQCVVWKLPND
jgi:O-methyltransferase